MAHVYLQICIGGRSLSPVASRRKQPSFAYFVVAICLHSVENAKMTIKQAIPDSVQGVASTEGVLLAARVCGCGRFTMLAGSRFT